MDPDYQMAVLLQKQFEHESLIDSDRQVALLIQQQFHDESQIDDDDAAKNLAYSTRKNQDSTKSLTDPSWEVIDPTPDIHVLFVAFNQRFFWNKLLAVSVSWSKRMTSCAGICSYSGRNGLCKITLSEPLLKLRPRKDLVETLLHEMIHAYLFVTHNNRDRDGHGPEFHKHMYRINADAGTKISVYHSFHDEVRVYLTHWWRCNGPCQHRKPFFGMVQRAMNRAPGPNDRWWTQHLATCGGQFIKVKEPEKKDQKKGAPSKPKADIRTYIPATKSSPGSINSATKDGAVSKTVVSGILSKTTTNGINLSNNVQQKVVKPNTTLINSWNTHTSQNKSVPKTNNYPNARTEIGGKMNTGSSLVIDWTQNCADPSKSIVDMTKNRGNPSKSLLDLTKNHGNPSKSLADLTQNHGNTSSILVDLTVNRTDAFNTVKHHWKDKYSTGSQIQNNTGTQGVKRPYESDSSDNKLSRIKIDASVTNNSVSENVPCPICGKEYTLQKLDLHIDTCVLQNNDVKECIICLTKVANRFYEEHVIKCVDENFKDNLDEESAVIFVEDTKSNINRNDNKQDSSSDVKLTDKDSEKDTDNLLDPMVSELDTKMCPVCDKCVKTVDYDTHLEACLHMMYSNMENNYLENSNTTTKCLACGKNIIKSQLNSHLEECMIDIFNDDFDSAPDIDNRDEYNCPFCLGIYSEKEMAPHIEKCIQCIDNTPQSNVEKSAILNSLFDTNEF